MAATEDLNWRPRLRQYDVELERLSLPREDSSGHHPLMGLVALVETASTTKKTKLGAKGSKDTVSAPPPSDPLQDPLSISAAADPLSAALLDPLSAASAESSSTFGAKKTEMMNVGIDETFEPWSSKRTSILSTYTTSQRIPITTSFLPSEEREKLETKAQAAAGDKVKNRLEQLDDLEDGSVRETLNLSQVEYLRKIEELNVSLVNHWDNDQRVKALKIAIQCSKLLIDTKVIQFYPSKFVLITDILDNFGYLVYDRIRRKSTIILPGASKPVMLPENFTSDQVPDSGKETCRNWFFKIASIRELIPRLYPSLSPFSSSSSSLFYSLSAWFFPDSPTLSYVEAAIMKCYSFLTNKEYTQALIRLTKMVRGIGDPLVAGYARAYLCRVGMSIAPESRMHLLPNFTDYLSTYSQLNSDHVQNTLGLQGLEMSQYMHLFWPAVEWILQCIAYKASEATLDDVLAKIKENVVSAPVLNAVMNSFKPEYIAQKATMFSDMVRDCEEVGLPKYKLYVSLGNCVVAADPPQKERLQLLNSVWKTVSKLTEPGEYIQCTQVWMEYVAKHFTKREVNTLLDDIIKHMTPGRVFENHYPELVSIINRILAHMTDFHVLFSMDKFLPFMDLLQKDSVKVEVCQNVVKSFIIHQEEETSDPVVINANMYLCKVMHDHLNALSLDDERRQIGNLVIGFLMKVRPLTSWSVQLSVKTSPQISFGRDFEQQLGFFVEARASFSNVDSILVFLIQSVNRLAMETRRRVKGSHTRKTAAFVRACAAYCYITIPSVDNILLKLNLYLLSGRVAISNGALSQGDAFFKAAINSLKDVPQFMEIDRKRQSTERFMVEYFNSFLSTLLTVPDNPDQQALYLLRGLLNGLNEYQWSTSTDCKMRVYINAICLLAAACQERYLYSLEKVDCNDSLYAGDPKLVAEVAKLVHTLLDQVMEHMKGLNTTLELKKRQSHLALRLFASLFAHVELSEQTNMSSLLVNLWNLACKHRTGDGKMLVGYHGVVKNRGARVGGHYQELAEQLSV
ncbi:VPS35 endosomal protein-sorting factor-like [Geodia barretti]|uniref:VPS35 endosomal protein-sorting factor-like n=1 Tax=Geodia barretti TaxID=519541 RepID=A0AA35WY53_GEOBA|nr:VPS35 endosomal protein-sorting factor-like [Geodia barretti]